MIFKTILHGLLAAALIVSAGFAWGAIKGDPAKPAGYERSHNDHEQERHHD
jgi:hypothetical protein